jgi:hypothetical protein
MRNLAWALSVAVIAAGGILLAGCEVDDSLPTRPRMAGPLTPDNNARDNAEHRALEAPPREEPAGGGREFPGQSKATTDQSVITADVAQPSGWNVIGHWTGPNPRYQALRYAGPIPPLPANPGTVPMPGSIPVTGTPWTLDYSWGQVPVLTDSPHRAWPQSETTYQVANVKHDPIYFFNLQDQLPMRQVNGGWAGDWVSNAVEVPWFYLNTAALPVLMVLEPPFAQRTSDRSGIDPNYHGHLPESGETVPTPTTGILRWDYPFLNPDGSVKEKGDSGTQPGAMSAPATMPAP